jgi:hypothetical protein
MKQHPPSQPDKHEHDRPPAWGRRQVRWAVLGIGLVTVLSVLIGVSRVFYRRVPSPDPRGLVGDGKGEQVIARVLNSAPLIVEILDREGKP